jgi:hypothetical protein
MKKDLTQNLFRFVRTIVDIQAYLNVAYLVIAFPLGIFYFVFLVAGISLGLSTLIIWVGIPILLLVSIGWCGLASFERYMAIHWLKEDIPLLTSPSEKGSDIWTRFKGFLSNPFTWKSMIFLFLKFPLGLATFVIMIASVSLTLAFLTAPITYNFLPDIQIGIFLGPGLQGWYIDSQFEALLGMLFGVVLWPLTLQITNGLTWIHAKFVRVMLDNDSMGELAKLVNGVGTPRAL